MQPLNNLHVRDAIPLPSPHTLRSEIALNEPAQTTIASGRDTIRQLISGEDPRQLIIVGPCSIHDVDAAHEYATWLKTQHERYSNDLVIAMRVYFEKPRTTVGWKGLINDPHLDGSHDMDTGLRTARQLLVDLANAGVLTASELLDPITPQYLADCLSWVAIGARTTESQTHREMASGLSMPVGFKNGSNGSLNVAINAMLSAAQPHSFLGIDDQGQASIIRTDGNRDCHAVLRGGDDGPNYDSKSVAHAAASLAAKGVCSRVLVDCSHGNSNKDHNRQPLVANDLAEQIEAGSDHLLGLMIESHLVAGRQAEGPLDSLVRGQSITDACIDLTTTEAIFERLATAQNSSRSVSTQ